MLLLLALGKKNAELSTFFVSVCSRLRRRGRKSPPSFSFFMADREETEKKLDQKKHRNGIIVMVMHNNGSKNYLGIVGRFPFFRGGVSLFSCVSFFVFVSPSYSYPTVWHGKRDATETYIQCVP